ncbi:MAG: oligosaccharide flippase family protein [Nitrososphaeraceae archaeon]
MSRSRTYSSRSEQTDESTQGLAQSALRGFYWTSLGTGVQAVLELLVLVVLARLLTPKEFGVFSAALVVVSITSIFSWFGIGWAVVQREVLEARHVRTAFTLSLLFSAAATGLIWLFAPSISSFFLIEGLTPVVRVMSLILLLQNASVVADSLLQRDLRFRSLSIIKVTALAVGFGAVGIILAMIGFGVWALVGAYLAKEFLKATILLIVQPHPKRPLIEAHTINELMVFSLGSTVTSVGNYLAVYGDSLVVGRWLGAEALGLYARAQQLMVAPAMV